MLDLSPKAPRQNSSMKGVSWVCLRKAAGGACQLNHQHLQVCGASKSLDRVVRAPIDRAPLHDYSSANDHCSTEVSRAIEAECE